MSAFQIRAICLIALLSALDGYDALSITFAAPAVSAAWGIGKATLGLVLSSGLVGMAFGSLLLGPLADLIGRRPTILFALLLMTCGALLCALAHNWPQLAGARIVTGLGIGTCVAVINPLAAEFANARRRALCVALMAAGYPTGGLIGGVISAVLLRIYTWPAVFLAGAAAGAALLLVAAIGLPESPTFLASRRDYASLERLNRLLQRCQQPPLALLPERSAARIRGYAALFGPHYLGVTIVLGAVSAIYAAVVYYVLSWLPQMVGDAGFTPSAGAAVSAIASVSGIVGCLLLGLSAHRLNVRSQTVWLMIGLAIAIAAFGAAPPLLPLLATAAGVCGLCMFAGAAGFYTVLAESYVGDARASGSGFVIGVGRVSSALAPALAGWLFTVGLGRAEVSAAFAAAAVVAAVFLARGRTSHAKV